MRNDKGVVINLSGVGQGVDFRLAVSGMTVKLTKTAKRSLKRGKKIKATLKVTVTPKGGAAASASKKVTLKR